MTPSEWSLADSGAGSYVERARGVVERLAELDGAPLRYVLSGLGWRQIEFAEQLLAEVEQMFGTPENPVH